jgi:hypothetical protein
MGVVILRLKVEVREYELEFHCFTVHFNFTVSPCISISLFHRAFQFTMCNGPNNALVCIKTLIQMSHIKTFKITPTCFDHQMIIIRELSDPG